MNSERRINGKKRKEKKKGTKKEGRKGKKLVVDDQG
jgi:hypothetical protein